MQKNIFIAMPAYTGEINCHTAVSLARAMNEARDMGARAQIVIRPLDSLLPRCRNVLVTEFLNSDATHLVFWDSDIACAPGAFTRLVSHDAAVIGGAYRSRSDPEHYIYRRLPNSPLPPVPDPLTGLLEVEGLGAGFLYVTRAAIECMAAAHPDLWVMDPKAGRLVWLFDCELSNHQYFSEDVVFCARARAAGLSVFLDTFVHLHHTGAKTFSGCYAEFLARQAAAVTTSGELDAAVAKIDAATAGWFGTPRRFFGGNNFGPRAGGPL
jgi:hypothetical protein